MAKNQKAENNDYDLADIMQQARDMLGRSDTRKKVSVDFITKMQETTIPAETEKPGLTDPMARIACALEELVRQNRRKERFWKTVLATGHNALELAIAAKGDNAPTEMAMAMAVLLQLEDALK